MNLEERIEYLKKEQENNAKRIEDAKKAQQEAEEANKEMTENLKKLEIAQSKYAEYEEAMKNIGETSKNNNDEKPNNDSKSNIRNMRFTAGILSGIAGAAILAGAYMLGKKNYEGPITEKPSASDTLLDESEEEEAYIEATKEVIEEKTNNLAAKFNQYGLKTESKDIKRLVYAMNINKIATDHPELIEEMIEEDSLEEVSQDFNQALMDINTYNGLKFRETGSTEEFIYISDSLIDSQDNSKMKEIEKRFTEISKISSDDELNTNVNKLLNELLLPEYDLSNLECGPAYAAYTMIELIRDLFMDKLNPANQDLIKYFVPYAEDYYKDNLADSWVNNRHNCHLNNIEYIIENPYSLEEQNAKKLVK